MTDIYLDLDKQHIIISFKFDREVIAIIKNKLKGGYWDGTSKRWACSIDNYALLLKLFPNAQQSEKLSSYFERFKKSEEKIVVQPEKLLLPVRDYQLQGADFLLNTGYLLGDKVGLGKSVQAILAAMSHPKNQKILIVTLASLKANWQREIKKWTGLDSCVILGTKRQRTKLWQQPFQFFICNYELVSIDFDLISNFDIVIFDEATALNNLMTKRSKSSRNLDTSTVWGLTASSIDKEYIRYFNLLSFLNPIETGSRKEFLDKCCFIGRFGEVLAYREGEIEKFIKQTAHMTLQRTMADIQDQLLPTNYIPRYLDMGDAQSKMYDRLVNAFVQWALETNRSAAPLTKYLRLRQFCDDPRLLDIDVPSIKSEYLYYELSKINEKSIVFTGFSQMANLIESDLEEKGISTLKITGDVKQKDRQPIIDIFNNDDDHKVLIMTEAGAFGLNIGRASWIIHYDCPWNPTVVEQREGRVGGLRQQGTVNIMNLIVSNSIDSYVFDNYNNLKTMSNIFDRVSLLNILFGGRNGSDTEYGEKLLENDVPE